MVGGHLGRLSLDAHVGKAVRIPFFPSLITPFPSSIADESIFIRDSPTDLILKFWTEQIQRLDGLIFEAEPLGVF